MAQKNLSWILRALRPRPRDSARLSTVPLGVRLLEDRATPAFTITPLAGNLLLQFQGNFENDNLTVSVSEDGSLRHNLVQPNLASEFDMNTSAAGEQRVFFFEVIRMTLAGGSGNDLLVNDTSIRSDMLGESGNDTLVGGAANDFLVASTGADQYSGRGGIDLLEVRTNVTGITTVLLSDTSVTVGSTTTADPAIETLRFFGASAADFVDASGLTTGPVTLFGSSGNDTLAGGAGNDMIDGSDGDDNLAGNGGDDNIDAGSGNDIASGGAGNDTAFGNRGSDSITGGEGNDSVLGDLSPTSISDGFGNDTVSGGDGDDVVFGGLGNDLVNGGAGTDRLFETGVNLFRLSNTVLEVDGLVISDHGFESADVTGSSAADVVDASGFGLGPVTLAGLAGNDTIAGGSGDDFLKDGDGANSISGGAGNDIINTEGNELMVIAGNRIDGGPGDDRVSAWFGDDTLLGGSGNDDLDAGFGSDVIFGGDGDDALLGASGADLLDGEAGNDLLFGDHSRTGFGFEPGNDTLFGGDGNDLVDGGLGIDQPSGGAGIDHLFDPAVSQFRLTDDLLEMDGVVVLGPGFESADVRGTPGDNVIDASGFTAGPVTIVGGGGFDTLAGGAGDDVVGVFINGADTSITGGPGNDTLSGGPGADRIDGGSGDDQVTGLGGADDIDGRSGDDQIDAGEGNNTVRGGSGNDRLFAGIGTDELDAGSGDDVVVAGEDDSAVGGSGFDLLSYFFFGTTVELNDQDLLLDGAVVLPHHRFENVVLNGNNNANVMDTTGFTGPVQLEGNGGADIMRIGPVPAFVNGGDGTDALTILGTAGADVFVVGNRTVTVNGSEVTYNSIESLTIDALGGVDAGSFLAGPIGIPFTAHGLEPTVSAGGNETIAVGAFTRSGSFTDIGNGQTWTATVDFGDGSGAQPLVLNPDGTFTLSHTYTQSGEFRVIVQITDNEGNIGVGEFVLQVTGP